MKKIFAIAWKDIRVRFTNRTELLFFLILPLGFTFILGGMSFSSEEGDPGLALLVVDEDASARSAEFVTVLDRSESVRVELLPRAEAEQRFEDESLAALLLIPTGFEQALLSGQAADLELRKAPNDLNALALEQSVRAAAGSAGRAVGITNASLAQAELLRPFADPAERLAYFDAGLTQAQQQLDSAPVRLQVTQPAIPSDSNGYDSGAQASTGQMVTWVFIPLLGTSEMFAFERARGTLRRLLSTPTRSATFLLGAISGQLAQAIVQMALLLGFGAWVMHINLGSSPAGLVVSLLAFALAAVALGTTLGAFTKTESQAGGLSIMLGMSMALLGGCWLPLELFPGAVRTAVHILPTTWIMQALTDLTMRGQGLVEILPETGVLLGFALVFFAVGVWRFRYE